MKKMTILIAALWAALALGAWVTPQRQIDDAERRQLAQMPAFTPEKAVKGEFQQKFEAYSVDQFPLRSSFRRLKAVFHYYALGQKDNNGIYLSGGYAVGQEYPLKEDSLSHALSRLEKLHDRYLDGSRVVFAVVPDKNYYLAGSSGQLSMDYDRLMEQCKLPWADSVDLTEVLSPEDFYRTDTHWRQERLLGVAEKLCTALGVTPPRAEDYRQVTLERPFYGVYYGQAALPMKPDTITLLRSRLLDECSVYDFESGKTLGVYDESKLDARDLYEVYLSGPRSLLTIENPNAATDRELLIFRDSFGSSLAPLLVQDYSKVTLVDLRYVQLELLDRFVDFHGQDVLILYSAIVLNNGQTIK